MNKIQRNKNGEFRGRRRFRGKMVNANGEPRAQNHKGTVQATAGFTVNDTEIRPEQSNSSKLAPYRVTAPTKRWQRRGIVRSATTGEQVK